MNEQSDRTTKLPKKVSRTIPGHRIDVEFSEERADPDDWEALERSERADARQKKAPRF